MRAFISIAIWIYTEDSLFFRQLKYIPEMSLFSAFLFCYQLCLWCAILNGTFEQECECVPCHMAPIVILLCILLTWQCTHYGTHTSFEIYLTDKKFFHRQQKIIIYVRAEFCVQGCKNYSDKNYHKKRDEFLRENSCFQFSSFREDYWVLRSDFNLHGTNLESRANFLSSRAQYARNMLERKVWNRAIGFDKRSV